MMIGKLIEAALLLPNCMAVEDPGFMHRCRALTKEARLQEADLTRELIAVHAQGHELQALIHLPFLLQRIGEKVEAMLDACRFRSREETLPAGKANAELRQFLAILTDMMSNVRDALIVRDSVLVESIIAEGNELHRMVQDALSTHWCRPQTGSSPSHATVMHVEFLESIKSASEDVESICTTLRELRLTTNAPGGADEPGFCKWLS